MSRFFNRTLSFLGLAEDEAEAFDEVPEEQEDIFDQKETKASIEDRKKTSGGFFKNSKVTSLDTIREGKKVRVFILEPKNFDEVQAIGDSYKGNVPVIINLQNATQDLSKRVIDFCSGLSYALGGSIKRVADKVFLLTPENVVVTSSDRDLERDCDIYNQY